MGSTDLLSKSRSRPKEEEQKASMVKLLVVLSLLSVCAYVSGIAYGPWYIWAHHERQTGPVMDITFVDVSNFTQIQQYAGILEEYDCTPFHPELKDPIDVSALDPQSLYILMMAYAEGDLIELCLKKPKENDRDLHVRRPKYKYKAKGDIGKYSVELKAVAVSQAAVQ